MAATPKVLVLYGRDVRDISIPAGAPAEKNH